MYQLEYLPMAKQDMDKIAFYISQELHNSVAAKSLINEMINTIERLIDFPYMYPAYRTILVTTNEYRKLIIKNYVIFYWVNEQDKKVVIARVIYARRDFEKLL